MTALLIDDEPLARQLLREYLQDFPSITVVGECANGHEAVRAINEQLPDLIFLDIRMPGMDGFEVLEHLTSTPHIIFSTAFGDHAVQAFEANAVDYLLKPYDRNRFARAVQKVMERTATSTEDIDRVIGAMQQMRTPGSYPERIFVRAGRKIAPVLVRDILWIEAEDDYARIHAAGASHLCTLGLRELEERLDPGHFMRVHRSHIVALPAIAHLSSDGEGGYIAVMKDGAKVRVGRTYASKIRQFVW